MPPFNQELIDRIRAAVDIVEIIGKDVKLQQRGRSYVGLCPFHDEKTPSFNVNRQEQLYYCFGCGQGGDVFKYIMESQNVPFPEAVRIIAEQVNIEVPHPTPQQQRLAEKSKQIAKVNHLAAQYYYRLLRRKRSQVARDYLVKRQIDLSLANRFYLGYADDEWDGLLKFFTETDIPLTQVEAAGLVIKGKNGYYDCFRNRIMFPICDANERFIGFGGRIIGSGEPKYLNSPETAVFRKSKNLYGLNWAKDAIKQHNCVIVVEGYTDCIGLYAKGLSNVVASLGTALTSDHVQLIARYTQNVIIAFDSDAAGAKATERGLDLLRQAGLNVRVASLPEGLDPDAFARKNTADEVKKWIAKAVPYVEYQIKRTAGRYNINSREGKIQASKEIINILKQLKSPIERAEYSDYVSNLLSVDRSVIEQELDQLAQDRDYGVNFGKGSKFPHITSKSRYTIKDLHSNGTVIERKRKVSIESSIMRLLLANPGHIEEMRSIGLGADSFADADYQHLFTLLLNGDWDRQGEAVTEKLFLLPKPPGQWDEYLQQFQVVVWYRSLNKIEENLSLVENHSESDVFLQLCGLLKQYYGVRREILLAKQ